MMYYYTLKSSQAAQILTWRTHMRAASAIMPTSASPRGPAFGCGSAALLGSLFKLRADWQIGPQGFVRNRRAAFGNRRAGCHPAPQSSGAATKFAAWKDGGRQECLPHGNLSTLRRF